MKRDERSRVHSACVAAVGDFYWWKLDPGSDWRFERIIFLNEDIGLMFGGTAKIMIDWFDGDPGHYWSKF